MADNNLRCPKCRSSGKLGKIKHGSCEGTGYKDCPNCDGGMRSDGTACGTCNAVPGKIRCGDCESGWKTCNKCDGDGYV